MSPSHRQMNARSRLEVQQHLAAAFDEDDVMLLALTARQCADQIRALDRMLNPVEPDLRDKAERLDHLSQLFFRTNQERPVLEGLSSATCAYCGGEAHDPVRAAGRTYCDQACARAAAA